MIWRAKELIEHLQTFEPGDQIAGQIWAERDVQYQLEELSSDLNAGSFHGLPMIKAKEEIDEFDCALFWEEYVAVVDKFSDRETEWQNSEMFAAIVETIEELIEEQETESED